MHSGGRWSQEGEALSATGELGDPNFGSSLAISADGRTAIVGGPESGGGAWIFARTGATWAQQGDRPSPPRNEGEFGAFGESVALSADGDTAIVGQPYADKGAGVAWVFTRWGATWS